MRVTKIHRKAAQVQIIFETHRQMCTVHDTGSLEAWLSSPELREKRFCIGDIPTYGDIQVARLEQCLNHLKLYSNFDNSLKTNPIN